MMIFHTSYILKMYDVDIFASDLILVSDLLYECPFHRNLRFYQGNFNFVNVENKSPFFHSVGYYRIG